MKKTNFKFILRIFILSFFSFFLNEIFNYSSLKADNLINDSEKNTLGIESLDSSSLRILNLKRIVYVGQCPGKIDKQAEGYFVDYSTPVKENLRIRLQNFARGLSPDEPPYVYKDYDKGRSSDKIKFKFGDKHNKVYLILREGLNPIKYEIVDVTNRKEKIWIKSGVFMLQVNIIEQRFRRDKEWSSYTSSYYCPIF